MKRYLYINNKYKKLVPQVVFKKTKPQIILKHNQTILTVSLPKGRGERRIIPSLSLPDCGVSWSVSLDGQGKTAVVGRKAEQRAARCKKLDLWVLDTSKQRYDLTFTINGLIDPQRQPFILSVTDVAYAPLAPWGLSDAEVPSLSVPSISQMDQASEIASRICYASCLAMACNLDVTSLAGACYHAPHDLYGLWPQGLWAIAQYGYGGLITSFRGEDEVLSILRQDAPIIASIAFPKGRWALPCAPLKQTNGHLVLITGMTKNSVIVNDPAGETKANVERHYPKADFFRVWRRHGGVGIIVLPTL